MTASSPPAASPRCSNSLRVWREEGAEDVDGAAATPRRRHRRRRATPTCCASSHFLHLRCEVPMPTWWPRPTELIGRPDVRLVSLMDHTPGQRQFRDERKLRDYYRGKSGGMTDAELDVLFAKRARLPGGAMPSPTIARWSALRSSMRCRSRATTTPRWSTSARRWSTSVAIAEFPTTIEAAEALHESGIRVLMGAPNLVRGGSHAGNVATADLAAAGLLDMMSSDYVPASLLTAALRLPAVVLGIDLAAAIRTVTKTPATAVGLDDRGEIAPGKRADLIQVRVVGEVPMVRSVWRAGARVA